MKTRKGIVLAGGLGTRLRPLTDVISKQLLPIFNKPMIFYPISSLMLAGIREILVIVKPMDLPLFKRLLRNGEQWGLEITYAEQVAPDGIAHALLIAEPFLKGAPVALILGDNLFHGNGLKDIFFNAYRRKSGASIFLHRVATPQRYGVATISEYGKVLGIEEKPKKPKSNMAVTGLYFYDENACEMAKQLQPSSRGEIEITDLNNLYIQFNSLNAEILESGTAWFDAGTFDSMMEASNYFHSLESRLGFQLGSPESVALQNGWIHK